MFPLPPLPPVTDENDEHPFFKRTGWSNPAANLHVTVTELAELNQETSDGEKDLAECVTNFVKSGNDNVKKEAHLL